MSEPTSTAPRRRQPGRMMMGGGGPAGMMRGEKAKDFSGTLKKLLAYLGGYRWMVLFVWVLAITATILSISGPKIMAAATNELVAGLMAGLAGTGGVNFDAILSILLRLAVIYGASSLLSYLQGFVMAGVTSRVTVRMRRDINDKIHRLPFRYFDGSSTGDVMSRITNDVATISQTMNQSLSQIIISITALLGAIVMMLSISWQMTLATLCVIPVTLVAITFIVKKSNPHFIKQQKYLGMVNGHVEEMLGSHVVVKSFNGEEASKAVFHDYSEEFYHAAWRANFLSGIIMPVTGFINNLGYVAVCVLGGWFAARGVITVGDIQAFVQYVRNFHQPLSQIANISNVLQQTMAAAERVFQFLAEEEEMPEDENALTVCEDGQEEDERTGLVRVGGDVAFAHVDFGYLPDQPVIHDFSAVVPAGQKIAIVGPTGAGKTTMVKLLMRFYDVTSGAILVDGYNVRQFRRGALRGLFGMVLQDAWLFHGTIADNIRYGKLDATDEEVYAAAEAAQVDHFIRTLPDGYNMVLNEEASNVSQGQKQLLTIARVILADPAMLILDEATSSVDTRTELLIQKAMDNLMRGRTSFVIAHRLSTIKNADMILVMRDGAIVETGTHDALLAADGFYASLYKSQFDVDEG